MEPLDPPLSDADFVLRLVYQFHYTTKGGVKRFKVDAFGLHRVDTDGLSVYLERPNMASAERLLAAKRRPDEFFVARLPVQVLRRDLGLRVEYTGWLDPDIPGHCSILDITFPMSQDPATQSVVLERQQQLAHFLTTHPEYIIRRPSDPKYAA